jgi:alpha-mannosidase
MLHKIRWTPQKLQNRLTLLKNFEYRLKIPLPPFRLKLLQDPFEPPLVGIDVDDEGWDQVHPGDYWIQPRTNFILRGEFIIPEEFKEHGCIGLYLPIGIAGDFSHPEALVYIDGEPFAACDRHHQEVNLPAKVIDGKPHQLALHGWTGIGGATVEEMSKKLQMGSCMVVQIDQDTRDFVATARVALGLTVQMEDRNPAKHHLLNALDEAIRVLDLRDSIEDHFYMSVPEAKEILNQGIERSGSPLDVSVYAVGHAHIDVAWLWTLGQTRQKSARTFHNVLRLMESFPNFHFTQSQPQLYEYLRNDYPHLFKDIQEKVSQGRWEIIGGMWVEADCNLSGSESLARQFLLGRTFYRQFFKDTSDSPVLWLPDVFGYAWNLPQLIKEAGLKYFFTIKIGWSQYNRLPYDSFWWQGLDGTRILTHFSTTKEPDSPFTATYNSDASPGQVLGTWINFQQKDYGGMGKVPPLLMSYGYGDGGGGPTREMLENIREMGDFPGSPVVRASKAIDFFKALDTFSENLPVWNGELYLEYHRGTYTTQAKNKRANRKSEFLLHDAEFLASYASIVDPAYEYPHEQLNQAWRLICLNQFHDIIPGSSIAPVYKDSTEQYEQVRRIGEKILNNALSTLSKHMGGGPLVVNPTGFFREEIIDLDQKQVDIGELPPYSVSMLPDHPQPSRSAGLQVSTGHIENRYLRVELNDIGDIIRIYDKVNQREILPDNAIGNQFLAFEDIPLSWDAWDVDIFYDDKIWLAEPASSIAVCENNPERVSLEVDRQILNSTYTQRISLSSKSPRLDFNTRINWLERQILLKVAFPVKVLSPTATYEIQWGNVERPTHRNTSWDWARFETAAQKWVDLSEGNYGVSLLNDCKYGHDIRDNVIRLTLLRGTTAPDPDADRGDHQFMYSLLPHEGRWGIDTVREAYAINNPILVYTGGIASKTRNGPNSNLSIEMEGAPSLVKTDKENIIIETVKRAENGKGLIIRLYEYQRCRGPFMLETIFPLAQAWQTNILEENQREIPTQGNELHWSIKPYQILTLRLIPDL